MARGRILSRTLPTSKKMLKAIQANQKLSEFIPLLYSWIIPQTDDYGHFDADPIIVKSKIMPLSKRSTAEFQKALDIMEGVGLIQFYEEKQYLEIVDFEKFQTFRADRKRHTEYPMLTSDNQCRTSDIPVGDSDELSKDKIREVKVREVKINKDKYNDCVELTKDEYSKLIKKFGEKGTKDRIEGLGLYIQSKGDPYKSHYHTILNWERKNAPKRTDTSGTDYPTDIVCTE